MSHRVNPIQAESDRKLFLRIPEGTRLYQTSISRTYAILNDRGMLEEATGAVFSPLTLHHAFDDDFEAIRQKFRELVALLSSKSTFLAPIRRYQSALSRKFLDIYNDVGWLLDALQICSEKETNSTQPQPDLSSNDYFACIDEDDARTYLSQRRSVISSSYTEQFSQHIYANLYNDCNITEQALTHAVEAYEDFITSIYGNTSQYSNITMMVEYTTCLSNINNMTQPWVGTFIELQHYYDDYHSASTWTEKLQIAQYLTEFNQNLSSYLLNETFYESCNWYNNESDYYDNSAEWGRFQRLSDKVSSSLLDLRNTDSVETAGQERLDKLAESWPILVYPYLQYVGENFTKTLLYQHVNSELFQTAYGEMRQQHSSYESTLTTFTTKLLEIENVLKQTFNSSFDIPAPVMTNDFISNLKFISHLGRWYQNSSLSDIPSILPSVVGEPRISLLSLVDSSFGAYRMAVISEANLYNQEFLALQMAFTDAQDELKAFNDGNSIDEGFFM